MSLFRRRPEPVDAQRSFELPEVFQRFIQQNYATVNPAAGNTALQSVAVWATADLIASLVSELPADVYANGRKRPGAIPENIQYPSAGQRREDWLYQLIMSWTLRGNAYGFGSSWDSRTGRARTVDLLAPSNVSAQDGPDGTAQWYYKGQRLEGSRLNEFVHRRVNPQPGQLLGLSVIEAHAVSIGVSLRSAQFGDQWFKDGAHPSGMLVNAKPLTEVQAATAKARLKDIMQGSRDPLVLGEGWDYKDIQVSPEESQFIETQRYSEAQCARMFGPGFAEIMGYETGGSMTYANVVDRRQDLLVLSMNKWIRRADRILTELLPPSTQTVRLDRDALLEATTLQRYQAHALALQWRPVNEIREIEDLPPIAGGDVLTKTNSPQGVTSGNAAQS